jgi:Rad3-related DNA helicase
MDRDCLIFDEGHELHESVSSYASITINEEIRNKFDLSIYEGPYKDGKYNVEGVIKYIETVQKELNTYQYAKGQALKRHKVGSSGFKKIKELINEAEALNSKCDAVLSLKCDLTAFRLLDDDKNKKGTLILTPLFATYAMPDILWNKNKKNVIFSGTILNEDYFLELNGLKKEETLFLSIDSPFDVKNRRILAVNNLPKIEWNNIRQTMKSYASVINKLLNIHKNEKGIIFVTAYYQSKALIEEIRDPRLITHDRDNKSKRLMMEEHTDSSNTVIVSSSMHKGIDLKDDLSRFQIVLKLPYKSLGDVLTKERTAKNNKWYSYETCKDLIQACGRSCRNENDHCITYILDPMFISLYQRNSDFFPKYIKDSISLKSLVK